MAWSCRPGELREAPVPPSPRRGRAPAVSSHVCPLWAQGAPGPSCHWSPSPPTLPPSLQRWSLLGLAGVTALDAVLRSRGAWAVLTFRPVALALRVQTADLGSWEALGVRRGAGKGSCARSAGLLAVRRGCGCGASSAPQALRTAGLSPQTRGLQRRPPAAPRLLCAA